MAEESRPAPDGVAGVREDPVAGIARNDGAIVVTDNHVIGKNGAAAASDRLLPADKGEPIDRSRRRNAGTPHRQVGGENARLVAHGAVRDQCRHIALDHAHGEDVARIFQP